ncbi:class I SAM-dependent methyltransferase [Desulfobacula sp.]|uniref:class I SAM-dependent methyltransferase n=1 Tax=Desulfobacula sp. TaxID=2593537 RepID=UPI0039B98316
MMKIDFDVWNSIKGFMDGDEAQRLYSIGLKAAVNGPVLEIGSYCGKSAYIIGSACKEKNSILFSIDHHKGSEEQQLDEEYFDPDLFDTKLSRVNTFPFFQEILIRTGLENTVVPIVASSRIAGKMWKTPISMLFIDGGHSFEACHEDFLTWACHIKPNGFLVIHDIFKDPEKGGQAPRQVYEIALTSGNYEELEMTKTLGVLKRK